MREDSKSCPSEGMIPSLAPHGGQDSQMITSLAPQMGKIPSLAPHGGMIPSLENHEEKIPILAQWGWDTHAIF